jgi:hypothetical protein
MQQSNYHIDQRLVLHHRSVACKVSEEERSSSRTNQNRTRYPTDRQMPLDSLASLGIASQSLVAVTVIEDERTDEEPIGI